MKSRDLQPRLFYPAGLSFKTEGEIRSFPDKKKLNEFFNAKTSTATNVIGLALRKRRKKKGK